MVDHQEASREELKKEIRAVREIVELKKSSNERMLTEYEELEFRFCVEDRFQYLVNLDVEDLEEHLKRLERDRKDTVGHWYLEDNK